MTGVVAVAVLTAGVVVALWWAGTRGLEGKELVSARLDALKTGLGIGIGGGGLFGLYLAWRRQRSTEADLDNRERALTHQQQVAARTETHQERVATATESDAIARRITDLYTKAAEQLGSDKAPVRLAGLYALERLAQDHPDQRQTIVNVLCAYLRMPYTLPGDPPEDDADVEVIDRHRERVQEREVRLTAQRVLAHHLRRGDLGDPAATFWADIDLDLTGAVLVDLDLDHTSIRTATLCDTRMVGDARFDEAQFSGDARFDRAQFSGDARFNRTQFSGNAWFTRAQFHHSAWFRDARLHRRAGFDGVRFGGDAMFGMAEFGGTQPTLPLDGDAMFDGTQFQGIAWFDKTRFHRRAWFAQTRFSREVIFRDAQFDGDVVGHGMQFHDVATFDGTRFKGAVSPEITLHLPSGSDAVT
ncbi:pentapeptide repeat-containing protein [Actinokineospora sp. PR83]|uniref:pentapeptide repeat-containing protein n=1 Tax=Actinokineospora sp. PR83 TaxID=2884908 RepID=UPI0027DEBE27|nr:pentapeptide repeat-containing protein [Actinokineospora sp. PR83]MCG8918258.1 pentapeptide repeat-containing protein [Actinokineospora sp. PR83]